MKTEVKTTIITNIDGLQFGYWDEEADEFVPIEPGQEAEAAQHIFECSPVLVEAIVMLVDNVRDSLEHDLRDIWQRLDKIEKRTD